MEDYDTFFNHAKVYTEVHARPNQTQRQLIADREAVENLKHQNEEEEKKK